jgi:hypothetical protein
LTACNNYANKRARTFWARLNFGVLALNTFRTSGTTYEDFAKYVIERGGRFEVSERENTFLLTVVFFPKSDDRGMPSMHDISSMDDRMSQLVILSAKRKLMLL